MRHVSQVQSPQPRVVSPFYGNEMRANNLLVLHSTVVADGESRTREQGSVLFQFHDPGLDGGSFEVSRRQNLLQVALSEDPSPSSMSEISMLFCLFRLAKVDALFYLKSWVKNFSGLDYICRSFMGQGGPNQGLANFGKVRKGFREYLEFYRITW